MDEDELMEETEKWTWYWNNGQLVVEEPIPGWRSIERYRQLPDGNWHITYSDTLPNPFNRYRVCEHGLEMKASDICEVVSHEELAARFLELAEEPLEIALAQKEGA